MKTGKFYVLLFPFVLLLFFFSMDCVLPSNSSALIGIKEGDAPKEIVLDDVNGNSVNVSSHFGKKPVILLFWKLSTNDAFLDYSLDELRLLKNIYEKLHNETGLEIFAIYTPMEFKDVSNDEILSVRKLIDVNEINFPVLIDRGFKFFREYGVIALPSTIMISKTGKIQFIYSSFPMSAHEVISGKIEELVGIAKDTQEDEVVMKKIADTRANRLYNYALQMSRRGLQEQAISALRKSMDLNPEDTWSHNLMGIILWENKMYDQATEELQRAIEIDSENITALMNYSVLLIEKKDYKEAERILTGLSPVKNKFKIRIHHQLGTIYKQTGRIDEAIKELETAYSFFEDELDKPRVPSPSYYSIEISVLHGLSVLYSEKGNLEKALEMLHKAFHEALGIGSSSSIDHVAKRPDIMVYE
jgi:peroxiredoxin